MDTTLFVEHGDTGDLFYTGPLEPAKEHANRDRYIVVWYDEKHKVWSVNFCDSAPKNGSDDAIWAETAEYGVGKTLEDAWRYALGAYWGPIDEGYMGDQYVLDQLDALTGRG